jgi:adenylate kinase
MRIVFLGPPGSGKGTQAQRLKDYLKICHLSTGEMLREAIEAGTKLGREADRYVNAGKLAPDEVVVGIVGDRLSDQDCAMGCLFDGFPRTVQQAEALDRMLAERNMPLDLVLALEVSEPQLFDRLLARGRPDDTRAAIPERFRQYNRLTQPLLDYYRNRGILRQIDADGTPDEVFAKVRGAVDAVTA